MTKKIKSIKCKACKDVLNGTMRRWLVTGKDKEGYTGELRGRGYIIGTCNKCGHCIG